MRRRLAAAAFALLAVTAGCGEGDGSGEVPRRVPADLTPTALVDDKLKVFENVDEDTVAAFANAGESTLVADGKLWEIRRGDKLVGTLQISTLLPSVDLLDAEVRERLVNQIILGQTDRIRVGDVEVFTTTANDKTTYLWFGAELYQVLQVKGTEFEPEDVIADVVAFQEDQEGWVPLPELIEEDVESEG